jgi:23S rRNA pseudouridine955/2504/2580 synthase
MERTQFRVHSSDDGSRLDRWCQRILGRAPNSVYQKALRKGLIRVDGKKADGADRVTTGQAIEVRGTFLLVPEEPKEAAARPKQATRLTPELVMEAQSWEIYRDRDIIVINKPAGLPVQGGSKVGKHLDAMLPALQGDARDVPRLVHRLDKDTSGVLVLARNVKAAAELQRCFAQKTMQKIYLALVVGVPQPFSGEIESNLDKLSLGEGSREMVKSVDEDGKRAVTRYRTREHLARKIGLMELEPVTGRTHQLRVHMAEMGCPILGDGKYGGKTAHITGGVNLSGKLHLHAWKLELPPLLGKPARSFTAPLSPHFAASLDALGLTL